MIGLWRTNFGKTNIADLRAYPTQSQTTRLNGAPTVVWATRPQTPQRKQAGPRTLQFAGIVTAKFIFPHFPMWVGSESGEHLSLFSLHVALTDSTKSTMPLETGNRLISLSPTVLHRQFCKNPIML